MQQWEYVTVRSDDPEIIQTYAQERWELVSAFPIARSLAFPGKKNQAARRGLLSSRFSLIGIVLIASLLVGVFSFVSRYRSEDEIPISQVVADVKAGRVAELLVYEDSNLVEVHYGARGDVKRATREPGGNLQDYLMSAGIETDSLPLIRVVKASTWGTYLGVMGFLLPTLIFAGIFIFLFRRAAQPGMSIDLVLIFKRQKAGE